MISTLPFAKYLLTIKLQNQKRKKKKKKTKKNNKTVNSRKLNCIPPAWISEAFFPDLVQDFEITFPLFLSSGHIFKAQIFNLCVYGKFNVWF